MHEDHFTFISNDLIHDVPFVELHNSMIYTYYHERDINIEIDIEFNDGCASQHKCVQAIQIFARRNVLSIRMYFETSHEYSKSDDLEDIVKGYASREVAATTDAAELYQFCNEKLTLLGSDKHKKMLNRLFFYLPKDNIESNQSSFPSSRIYRPIPSTRKIHQIMNVISEKNGVYAWNFSCLCKFYYSNGYKNCIYLDDAIFTDKNDQRRPIWHIFKEKGRTTAKVKEDKDKDSSNSKDPANKSEEEINYKETEASCIVKCHDVAIVCTGDGFLLLGEIK